MKIYKYELRHHNVGRDDYGTHLIKEGYYLQNTKDNRGKFMSGCMEYSMDFLNGISSNCAGFLIKEIEVLE